jgi:hypothetical protein
LYDDCCVLATTAEDGDETVEIIGHYRHHDAFHSLYDARAAVRLWGRRPYLGIGMEITNRRRAPMQLMYMAHVNFRPVDYGRLVQSASLAPSRVAFRRPMPDMPRSPAYDAFLQQLEADPSLQSIIDPTHPFDPEVVCSLDYLTDPAGIAHTLQVHRDGTADFVRHRPAELPVATRWIVRNGDEDALGMVLPGTAGPEGYTIEGRKGRLVSLASNQTRAFRIEAGVLTAQETSKAQEAIRQILAPDRPCKQTV